MKKFNLMPGIFTWILIISTSLQAKWVEVTGAAYTPTIVPGQIIQSSLTVGSKNNIWKIGLKKDPKHKVKANEPMQWKDGTWQAPENNISNVSHVAAGQNTVYAVGQRMIMPEYAKLKTGERRRKIAAEDQVGPVFVQPLYMRENNEWSNVANLGNQFVESISITSSNKVYFIKGGQAYMWNGSTMAPLDDKMTYLKSISTSADGTVWAVRVYPISKKAPIKLMTDIYSWDGAQWKMVQSFDGRPPFSSLTVQDKSNIWALMGKSSNERSAHKWNAVTQQFEQVDKMGGLIGIRAASDGTVCAEDMNGKFYRWEQ